MNWKIWGAISITVIVISGIVIYISLAQSTTFQTPPAYEFHWKLSIFDKNNATVTLEIENITIEALNTEESQYFIDITNKTKIPLYSLVDCSGKDPVSYPFNSSYVIYKDVNGDGVLSVGDRILVNRSNVQMDNYLNFSFTIITGYPWEKLSYKHGIIGSNIAIAKVPPPYVKVTPAVLDKVYDYDDHCWQVGGDIPYYIWSIQPKYEV